MLHELHLSELVDSHRNIQDLVFDDTIFLQDLEGFVFPLILEVVEPESEGSKLILESSVIFVKVVNIELLIMVLDRFQVFSELRVKVALPSLLLASKLKERSVFGREFGVIADAVYVVLLLADVVSEGGHDGV